MRNDYRIMNKAIQWHQTQFKFKIKSSLQKWKIITKYNQSLLQIKNIVNGRWNRCFMRMLICKWRNLHYNKIKNHYNDSKSKLNELNVIMQHTISKSSQTQLENVQIVQRLHQVTADCAQLKLKCNELDSCVLQHQEEKKEFEMIDSSLRDEIENLKCELQQLKNAPLPPPPTNIVDEEKMHMEQQQMLHSTRMLIDEKIKLEKKLDASLQDHQSTKERLNSCLEMIGSLKLLLEEKNKKHSSEIEMLKSQMSMEMKQRMNAFANQKYEMDLLHSTSSVKQHHHVGRESYVHLVQDEKINKNLNQHFNVMHRHQDEIKNFESSSLISSDSFMESSVNSTNSHSEDLDLEFNKMQQQIARLNTR
ncbi:hypothetical protein AKO1_002564 [Acrasis kona]|uniref:Uncharacterized protein n=1 Tax=Acrasis kona TaxID=1008807 RepID=A0AAW2ZM79_9EUKA